MPDVFRLPRLKTLDRVTDSLGRPTLQFLKFFNTDFAGAIERQERAQAEADAQLAEVVAGLAAAVEDIQEVLGIANTALQTATEAQEAAADLLEQSLTLAASTQAARSAANTAQSTADAALGAGTVSGSATDPAIDLTITDEWVQGPQVDLVGVVAGDLTITGTGPDTDPDVVLSSDTSAQGEFRVMEIDAGVETEVFSGTFSAIELDGSTMILNQSTTAVAEFSEARTSTGAISYRIDARKTSGGAITSLSLYIYARRAA